MHTCSVLTCQTRKGGMHTFPTDSEVRKQWIQFCGRGPRWCPLFSSKVCHLHFTPDDFTISSRVKAGSVPQLLSAKSSQKRSATDIAESNKKHCKVEFVLFADLAH
jgi:hypothetical protein